MCTLTGPETGGSALGGTNFVVRGGNKNQWVFDEYGRWYNCAC